MLCADPLHWQDPGQESSPLQLRTRIKALREKAQGKLAQPLSALKKKERKEKKKKSGLTRSLWLSSMIARIEEFMVL